MRLCKHVSRHVGCQIVNAQNAHHDSDGRRSNQCIQRADYRKADDSCCFFHYRFQVIRKLFFYIYNQIQFVQLFLIEEARCVKHHVASAIVLREGNAVADAIQSGKDAHPTVETISQTSMRGCTILESIHQEAKLLLCLLWRKAQDFEHLSLQLRIVDTD